MNAHKLKIGDTVWWLREGEEVPLLILATRWDPKKGGQVDGVVRNLAGGMVGDISDRYLVRKLYRREEVGLALIGDDQDQG